MGGFVGGGADPVRFAWEASPALAQETDSVPAGLITIERPWARASAGTATVAGVFMTLHNGGAKDRLIRAASPAAGLVEIHQTRMEDGVMRMRPVEALDLAPGTDTVLRPGGLHVMLIDLKAPLVEGERVRVDLTFEHAGPVTIEAIVRPVGAQDAGAAPKGQ
ncbi:hypothetical protein ROR02_16260 [Pararhodospirillum oryzae]|uniref:Transporter n=2 Tax=Pararhodospirillum oryzae TaxID=478448 RepID=A0A512H7R3_9PROT|nr:hypothetical protein ROR02_16260 [Pararhodospirillum oryzae]